MSNQRSNVLFITGTDTGVGKTVVSSLLVKSLINHGLRVRVSKPVETGCPVAESGELIALDGESLRTAAGNASSIDEIVPYRYSAPAAPVVAADLDGRVIDFEWLVNHLNNQAKDCELLIIEGAGGLLVPLSRYLTFADLCDRLNAQVLLVVGSKLGAINHSLLTIEVLLTRSIPIVGYLFNDLFRENGDTTNPALRTNREVIRDFMSRYLVSEIGYLSHLKSGDYAGRQNEAASELATISRSIIEYFSLER